tara:strand:- start:2171 stop:4264 length:2094 start_codon:yes stop_codon:yes gene_type:complete
MEKRGIAIFVLVMFMISFASAEVFFAQQPRDTYSLGEQIGFVIGSDGTEGWVNVDLKCGGGNTTSSGSMVFFHYLTAEELSLPVSVPLTKEFLREMGGDCFFSMVFDAEVKESLPFEISSELTVGFELNKEIYSPNETVYFTGSVVKKSGGDVSEGFAEVRFPYNGVESIVVVSDGEFNGNISLQESIPSGEYGLDIFIYEKDDADAISNFHLLNSSISVLSEPRILNIDVSDDVGPDKDLGFTAYLYDQADETVDGVPVAFTLINSLGEQVLNLLSETGVTESFRVQKNAPRGYWNLSAQSEGFNSGVVEILIGDNVEAEFLFVNDTLVVKNVGNIPYDKFVEVSIGENYTRVLALNLSLGGSVEFQLEGPDGEYDIFVDDGEANIGAVALLTGDVIGIKSPRGGGLGFLNRYVFSWIIIIGILGMFVFVSARRVLNRKSVLSSKNFKPKKSKKDEGGVVKVSEDNQESSVSVSGASSVGVGGVVNASGVSRQDTADNSLVVQGEKQKASFLSLNVKNQGEINKGNSNANGVINEAVDQISSANGKVYRSGNHVVGVFAPAITKTFDNNMDAIRVADSIAGNLKEHNQKYAQKIDFGIGINEGEIIADKREGKLLFTPLGNSIQVVKKVSEIADNGLLLSEGVNTSLNGKVRTLANSSGDLKTFAVNDVLDKASHAQFINKFLDRNDYKKLDDFKV